MPHVSCVAMSAARGMQPTLALLRGVNVGGRGRVPMAGLRDVATRMGLTGVRTYLQSGNLLFEASPQRTPEDLGRGLEEAIAAAFGVDVGVILRTRAELEAAVDGNPFPEAEREPTKLHLVFLAQAPAAEGTAGLDRQRFHPDTFEMRGREVYIRYAEGAGRSKLTHDRLERALGTRATARNWNTVTKLLAMMGA